MLAIGSIVYLKQGTSKLMILNRGPIIEVEGEQTWFDYFSVRLPSRISAGSSAVF